MALAVMLKIECQTCGHEQSTEAIHPRFEGGDLVDYFAGSDADYCAKSDRHEVKAVGFYRVCHCGAPAQGPPSDYPDVCSQWPICEKAQTPSL